MPERGPAAAQALGAQRHHHPDHRRHYREGEDAELREHLRRARGDVRSDLDAVLGHRAGGFERMLDHGLYRQGDLDGAEGLLGHLHGPVARGFLVEEALGGARHVPKTLDLGLGHLTLEFGALLVCVGIAILNRGDLRLDIGSLLHVIVSAVLKPTIALPTLPNAASMVLEESCVSLTISAKPAT